MAVPAVGRGVLLGELTHSSGLVALGRRWPCPAWPQGPYGTVGMAHAVPVVTQKWISLSLAVAGRSGHFVWNSLISTEVASVNAYLCWFWGCIPGDDQCIQYCRLAALCLLLFGCYTAFTLSFPLFSSYREDKGLETEIGDLINLRLCSKIQRDFQRSWSFLLHFDSFGTFLERQVRKLHFHSLSFP